MSAVFDALRSTWGSLDFVVHAVAFSEKAELKGRYADTTRENFQRTMLISCFSFTEVARLAAPLMQNGGALLTLTYGGSMRVMPNYNVMGIAKAALEASVRYLAADFGERGIRVNAISAGPVSHTCRRRRVRRATDVHRPARECAATWWPGNRGDRGVSALFLQRSFAGSYRRNSLRRLWLQYCSHAAARPVEGWRGEAGRRGGIASRHPRARGTRDRGSRGYPSTRHPGSSALASLGRGRLPG